MKISNIKEKVKTNYAKNPKALNRLSILGLAVLSGIIGTLTGVIEPDMAAHVISALITHLSLGV